MEIKEKTVYMVDDGSQYDTREEAEKYITSKQLSRLEDKCVEKCKNKLHFNTGDFAVTFHIIEHFFDEIEEFIKQVRKLKES